MARNLFGGSSDDYAVDTNGRPLPNRRIRFYTSAAMTTEITDLASDAAGTGAPLTVSTDGHGFWGPVYGPDGVTVMYAGAADGAGNPPTYVVAVDTRTPTSGGVTSFNTRTGPVALSKADVTGTGLAAADVGADASGAAATVQTNLTTEITRAQAAEAALGGGMQFRTAVVVATTNQALTGLPTVDGVTLTAGQVILLTAQTTGSQNGLWAVASGAWARPANFAVGLNATATSVLVESGTTGAGATYAVTGTTNNVVGTNVLTFVKTSGSAASSAPVTMADVPLAVFVSTGATSIPAGGSHAPSWVLSATGEDYWGVPGSAQPLAITVLEGDATRLVFPDEADGAMYDVVAWVNCTANVADAGKYVSIDFGAWGLAGGHVDAIVKADGSVYAAAHWVDATFTGDTGAAFLPVFADAINLANTLSIDAAHVMITKRIAAAPNL